MLEIDTCAAVLGGEADRLPPPGVGAAAPSAQNATRASESVAVPR